MKIEKWEYPGGSPLAHISTTRKGRAVILLTSAFRPATRVNVIVYYHGNWVTPRSGVTSWSGLLAHFTLAGLLRAVEAAGKPLALVIPDIGEFSSDAVGEKAEWEGLIDDVLLFAAYRSNALEAPASLADPTRSWRDGKPVQPLALGNLVIAGHSGAGKTIRKAVQNGSRDLDQLREIWMFDSLYSSAGSAEEWIQFATKTIVAIHIFYNDTKAKAIEIQDKAKDNPAVYNIKTIAYTPDHDKAPGAHVGKLIKDSPWL